MRILIKRALVVDPLSRHHTKKRDIFIRKGIIEKIGRSIDAKADRVVEYKDLHISPGWCDIGTQIGEPGLEHREDVESVARAAASGGFTTLACFPNTLPVLDNRTSVEYVQNRGDQIGIHITPVGAITLKAEGKEITELQDMHTAGAVAFSDGRSPMSHSGIMLLALQYVKTFGGIVINRPFSPELVSDGQMHESVESAKLGMRGFPHVSERITLERDLRLLEYSGSRLHVFGVSSADSANLLKRAKRSGLAVSSSVPAHNLLFTDTRLADFDTNFKVLPPLREESDRKALVKGVLNGSIDVICSNHEPLEEECKKLEFAHADFGSTGLQTAYAIANTALGDQTDPEILVKCLSHNPREILQLPMRTIEEGGEADLTMFDPNVEWTPSLVELTSKSKNSAALNITLRGRALGTVCKGSVQSTDNLFN